jgi:hypothetical protein
MPPRCSSLLIRQASRRFQAGKRLRLRGGVCNRPHFCPPWRVKGGIEAGMSASKPTQPRIGANASFLSTGMLSSRRRRLWRARWPCADRCDFGVRVGVGGAGRYSQSLRRPWPGLCRSRRRRALRANWRACACGNGPRQGERAAVADGSPGRAGARARRGSQGRFRNGWATCGLRLATLQALNAIRAARPTVFLRYYGASTTGHLGVRDEPPLLQVSYCDSPILRGKLKLEHPAVMRQSTALCTFDKITVITYPQNTKSISGDGIAADYNFIYI